MRLTMKKSLNHHHPIDHRNHHKNSRHLPSASTLISSNAGAAGGGCFLP
uniref:Uncharacterized protein n=1 Tax=Rhizophora mucronata TaxID=61149 RepID=A0A2P2NGJ2_RHIMU